jgi:signal transduction histidine kinase
MKLRPRIALVSCLAALVSVGATGALIIRQSHSYALDDLLQRQTLLVQNRAFALGDALDVAARELTRLSKMAEVDLTDNDLRPEATLLAHAHRNSALFNIGLQIEDASGRCLWAEPSSPDCPGRSYAREPWFVEGRRASGPVVSGGADGGVRVNLVVPIGGRPGAADGVLRGIIDPRSDRIISPVISGSLPAGTEAVLVDEGGKVVFPEGFERTGAWDEAIRAAPTSAAAFATDEPEGRFVYAHAPVAHARWGLVFRWPYRTLDVGVDRQVQLLLWLLALGGALAVVLGFASSRYVTRPLEELLRAVRALGPPHPGGEGAARGENPEEHVVARSDELGELARAFAELRARLAEGQRVHQQDIEHIRELAASLDARVRERTAEVEEAQRSLVAQERLAAMGRAAAVISHELKNSLNALGVGFDLFTLEAKRAPHLVRVNQLVHEEVNRLRVLTDELLIFARAPRLQVEPADLNALVRRTIDLCSEQAAAGSVEVGTELAGDGAPLVVPCDVELIRSVLVNLLQNAIEAVTWSTPPGAQRRVVVSTRRADPRGHFVDVAVDDTGPGLSAESREHLFEPFFTTKRTGTGLGLATAQRFVGAHGGHIEVEGSALGGARFVVRLPLRPARGSVEAA